jgi:hypothetical protein
MSGSIGCLNIKDSKHSTKRPNEMTKEESSKCFAVANNETMHMDDPDIAFLVENPFDLADNLEDKVDDQKTTHLNLTASQTLSKPIKTSNSNDSVVEDSHKDAKMVTVFSIETEMADQNDSRHFLNISDVEEEKQSRQKIRKGQRQRLA